MKSLILVRHAKSSWDNVLQKDFDRSLNERGHRDAPMMARRLKERPVAIDAFISSPANRALTTAAYFAEAYSLKSKDIIQVPDLYHASIKAFYEVISKVDNAFSSIALFSHNNGITDFINTLTDTKIDDMPTCGIFAIKVKIDKWEDFLKADKEFWFFDSPKKG